MTKAIEAWVERNKAKFQGESEKSHLIDFLKSEFSHKNSINFTYEACLIKADTWMKALHKKASFLKTQGKFKVVQTFPDGFTIVNLLDDDATIWEGREMGHCVGSHGYKPNHIYSLRDPQGLPHATLEIKRGVVEQVQGKENKDVVSKYRPYVISFIMNQKLSVNCLAKSIGLIEVSFMSLRWIKKNFNHVTVIPSSLFKAYVLKDDLRLKEGVKVQDLPVGPKNPFHFVVNILDLTNLIDIHTTPSFYQNTKDAISIGEKLNAYGITYWDYSPVRPSGDGYKEAFIKDKAHARSLLSYFGIHGQQVPHLLSFLLKKGMKEEVVYFLKSFKYQKHDAREWAKFIVLLSDKELTKALLQGAEGSSLNNKESFIFQCFPLITSQESFKWIDQITEVIPNFNFSRCLIDLTQVQDPSLQRAILIHMFSKAKKPLAMKKAMIEILSDRNTGWGSDISAPAVDVIIEGVNLNPNELLTLIFEWDHRRDFDSLMDVFEKHNLGRVSLLEMYKKRKALINKKLQEIMIGMPV